MASQENAIIDKLSALRSVSSQALHKIAFNEKQYDSVIEFIIDVLRSNGVPETVVVNEILKFVVGPELQQKIEKTKDNTTKAIFDVVNDWDEDEVSGWLLGLEDAVKSVIANILTSILSCSVNPFLPLYAMDDVSRKPDENTVWRYYGKGILIPISVLDFSGVLDVAPLGMAGQFFYDINYKTKYYQKIFKPDAKVIDYVSYKTEYYYKRITDNESKVFLEDDNKGMTDVLGFIKQSDNVIDNPTSASPAVYTVIDGTDWIFYKKYERQVKETRQEYVSGYTYIEIETEDPDIVSEAVLSTTIPVYTNKEDGEKAPQYIRLEKSTVPGTLYRTKDFNAFMWNALNRGNTDTQTEKNKMMWDSRRLDKRKNGKDTRIEGNGWAKWLMEKGSPDEKFEAQCTDTLFPILQLEKYEGYTQDTCLQVSFPAERYNPENSLRKTIYDFNRDYLNSINIFNPKVIVMNMLMELTKVKIFPEITSSVSIKKRMMDAKLTEIIAKILSVDDMNVSDCFYSFSNKEYSAMLREADLRQYGAKSYDGNGTNGIFYTAEDLENGWDSISSDVALNKDTMTITRNVFDIALKPGEKGQVLTSLGLDMSATSNLLTDIIYAITMPLIRAVFSPQVMLLFMINFEVMGLVDLSNLEGDAFDKLISAIFRKLVGSVMNIAIQIKDAIATILYRLLEKTIKPILDDVLLALILEELDAWLILLREALNILNKNDIPLLDDVHYADIRKEQTKPENESEKC